MEETRTEQKDPVAAAVLGLLLPGGGHVYTGRFAKAAFFFTLICGTFFAGLILSDFRAVSFQHQPYWFLGQLFAGLPSLAAALLSPDWQDVKMGVALEAGTLYTTVAGLLNIMVIMDAAYPGRAGKGEETAAASQVSDAESPKPVSNNS